MTRTRLRDRFLKGATLWIDKLIKNKGIIVSLIRENKKQYYGSLNVNHIRDN